MAMTTADLPARLDCGHAPQPTFYSAGNKVTIMERNGTTRQITTTGEEVMFPGYAHTPDGRRICPPCADSEQAAAMSSASIGDKVGAYLSSDDRNVTTWTGGVLARVTRVTRNARQTFVRAMDAEGHMWAGIGPAEHGTYVTLRRIKGE